MNKEQIVLTEYNLCECGCKNQVTKIGNKFIKNHHTRNKRSHCWKGGKYKNYQGYILIYKPDYQNCNSRGYVLEHRLVYEQYYNCCLLPYIHIHHINEIRTDNRIENLEPMTKSKHRSLHGIKYMSYRKCLLCSSNKTYNRNWFKYNDGFICHKCYNKIYYKNRRK